MASPGGPAHVMLTDREAEHIPGCNMAFYRWALDEIGGFDPVFTRAGDDVDVCWQLQQAGHKLGFCPAGFVWHYRRPTVAAYLRQQQGYGEAEALLVRKHPENFNLLGGGVWRGRIYGSSKPAIRVRAPVIYHGLFGSAGFQRLYTTQPANLLMLSTSLEYHLFVTLPLWILSPVFRPLLVLAIAGTALPLIVCALAGAQAELPTSKTRWWSRPLVAMMFLLQPIVRGWARYRGRLSVRTISTARLQSLDSLALRGSRLSLREHQYWANRPISRIDFVAAVMRRLDERGWPNRADTGWANYDVEIYGSRWSCLQFATLAEDHPNRRRLLRTRLRPGLALAGRIVLGLLVAVNLLVIGSWQAARPWSFLILLTIPLCAWFLMRDQRNLQSIAAALIDELARELNLVKIHASPAFTTPDETASTGPSRVSSQV
jgi:hypothetical protein